MGRTHHRKGGVPPGAGGGVTNAATIKAAREAAGLSAREAAGLVGVTTVTWQRWEGQSSRATEIPYAHWNLFLLLVGAHPVFTLSAREG